MAHLVAQKSSSRHYWVPRYLRSKSKSGQKFSEHTRSKRQNAQNAHFEIGFSIVLIEKIEQNAVLVIDSWRICFFVLCIYVEGDSSLRRRDYKLLCNHYSLQSVVCLSEPCVIS